MNTEDITTPTLTKLNNRILLVGLFTRQLVNRYWMPLLDIAWIVTLVLLYYGEAKVFYFHFLFVFLTFGAFYWAFQPFVVRSSVALTIATTSLAYFVFNGTMPADELIEIPLLATMLVLVFSIALQRSNAQNALRKINGQLELRIEERTAHLQREITIRQAAQQTLLQSREHYRQLAELSFEGIAIHTNGRLLYANPACVRLLGATTSEELIGRLMIEFVHPEHLHQIQGSLQTTNEDASNALLSEEKFIRLDGSTIDVEIVTICISYMEQLAMLTVIRDITMRKLTEQARLAERTSIARDLHDWLGQNLGYLHLQLDHLANLDPTSPLGAFQKDLLKMCHVANESYLQVRGMIASLMPANTIQLAKAVRDQSYMISQRANFAVQVVEEGENQTLAPVVQQQVLSLCREALTNIAKHSNAKQAKIELNWHPANLGITIWDDGNGFDMAEVRSKGTFGLRIMEERASQIDGILQIRSESGKGTQLTVQIPLT